MIQKFSIHWFRRDLRIEGNAVFWSQVKINKGRVLGLFIIDQAFLKRSDFSETRFNFFLKTLSKLKESLNAIGSDLMIVEDGPAIAWHELLSNDLKNKPQTISYNRDYEPFARMRDNKFKEQIDKQGIEVVTQRDHLIIEPHELLKDDNTFYKVYTPFSKKWKSLLKTPEIQKRIDNACWSGTKGKKYCDLKWDEVSSNKYKESDKIFNKYLKPVEISVPEAGHQAALKSLQFFSDKVESYEVDRDIPSIQGTSKLSIFFKNGSLTTAQVVNKLKLSVPKISNSKEKFLNELIWREFYYHLLYHQPEVEKEEFQQKYANLKWQNNAKFLKAWKEGKTGFPIIDAGMRELNTTGLMHNRVRMIVASFLCKDLLIDYREGEKYFMEKLLDGDLAPNNGGWQWAASTGCDAQPYFRIFNPWTQAKRFDPDCIYIKKFVVELKNDLPKNIHDPEGERAKNYPRPIVEHDVQRVAALKIYNPR